MNRASLTLGTVVAVTAGVVVYVHLNQEWEKARMHEGVLRDKAREVERKRSQKNNADAS
jgi:hypothetical protein